MIRTDQNYAVVALQSRIEAARGGIVGKRPGIAQRVRDFARILEIGVRRIRLGEVQNPRARLALSRYQRREAVRFQAPI